MDPLGENQATAAMSLLKSLLPDATDAPDTLNNTHTPDTTNTPSTPVTPKIPATTTQPVAPVAPVVPVAPVAPVAEMNSAPSLPNTQQQGNEDKDEGICGWLTVTESSHRPASEFWYRLANNRSRLVWWKNNSEENIPEGTIDICAISSICLPYESLSSDLDCEIRIVHVAQNVCLIAPNNKSARKWSMALQEAVFECGTPPPCIILDIQDVFDLMRLPDLNEESLADDLEEYISRRGATIEIKQRTDSVTGERLMDQAVSAGLLGVVNVLLSHGVDLLTLNEHGSSALHLACARSNSETLNGLLQLSSMSTQKLLKNTTRQGETCAHVAAGAGNVNILESLVRFGVDVYALDSRKRTALHACCAFRHRREYKTTSSKNDAQLQLTCLQFLCEAVPDMLDWTDEAGATALHLAADQGDEGMVLALLQTAAQPDFADMNGRTPYSIAVRANHTGCADILAQYGGSKQLQEHSLTQPQMQQQLPKNVANNSNEAWVRYIDEASSHPYWYNNRTGETSWGSPMAGQKSPASPPPRTQSPINSSSWRYDRSGDTPPPTTSYVGGHQYYQRQSPMSGAGSSSMSDSSSDDVGLGSFSMRLPQVTPILQQGQQQVLLMRSERRKLSPGSLALLPVDTGLANAQSQGRVAEAVAAHSPLSSVPSPARSPPFARRLPHDASKQHQHHVPPGPSPLSSSAQSLSSDGSSLGSPQARSTRMGGGTQRSPTARLAFALSPMEQRKNANALIEERKQARAERRAAQKARRKQQKDDAHI